MTQFTPLQKILYGLSCGIAVKFSKYLIILLEVLLIEPTDLLVDYILLVLLYLVSS